MITQVMLKGHRNASHLNPKWDLFLLKLFAATSFPGSPSLAPGGRKMRDPGNEAGIADCLFERWPIYEGCVLLDDIQI